MNHTPEDVRAKVERFVRANFRLPGTLSLHRAALGWDMLRAPVNVALAPVFLVVMLAAAACRLARFRRAGAWLGSRKILLRTSVAREVERRIAEDLLGATKLDPVSRKSIDDYTGLRSAVAEITTSLIVLVVGLMLFGTATPGITSLAPIVSGYVAHSSAVASFPLGSALGGVWYGVFPVELPVWFVVGTGVALAMVASLVTTFAGIIADPLQAHLGIHQRRLLRLLDGIAKVEVQPSGLAPEHFLARLADVTDAGLSLSRLFRP